MDGEEGGGIRLSKRFSDKGGEVDYKTKAGTAWSHSYLNQKPWHPLSYPNQRRKWIAEQTHAQRQRRSEEVSREYAQEQEFYRQTALISKKEKEKVELMQAVSFMYVRPPGYNAESAKAAELADERKREELSKPPQDPNADGASSSMLPESLAVKDHLGEDKKKSRPKDVFGRPLPTEEEFEILKNAPRLDTGVPARVKPFGVEVRNVKCLRCGNYGHQSGDRECPLKDAIMPSDESRLKRDDPLNAILAHTDPSEPLKWELKQKPGISPPRGGFNPDDPNQQIVAEDIFDEYGGFLGAGDIPELLTNFSRKPKKLKKSKRKRQKSVHIENEASSDDGERRLKQKKVKVNKKKQDHSTLSSTDTSHFDKDRGKSRHKGSYSTEDSDRKMNDQCRSTGRKHSHSPKSSGRLGPNKSRHIKQSHSPDGYHESRKRRKKHSYSSEDSDSDRDDRSKKTKQKHSYSPAGLDSAARDRTKQSRKRPFYSFEDSDLPEYHGSQKRSDDSDHQSQPRVVRSSGNKHSSTPYSNSEKHHRNHGSDRYHGSHKSKDGHGYTSEDFNSDRDDAIRTSKQRHSFSSKVCESIEHNRSKHSNKRHSSPDGYNGTDKGRDERFYSTAHCYSRKHHKS